MLIIIEAEAALVMLIMRRKLLGMMEVGHVWVIIIIVMWRMRRWRGVVGRFSIVGDRLLLLRMRRRVMLGKLMVMISLLHFSRMLYPFSGGRGDGDIL